MSETEGLVDLRERLVHAAMGLRKLAKTSTTPDRLHAKAEGVDLALSYVEETLRGALR